MSAIQFIAISQDKMSLFHSHYRRAASHSRLFFLAIALLSFSIANAGTITSTAAGGNWRTTTTWVGGVVPLTTDNVIIATTGAGAVTTATNGTITCVNLTINTGAKLTMLRSFNVTGVTSISGTIAFGSTSARVRAMTFTGAVTLNSGAIWDETNAGANTVLDTYTFQGNFTNNATTFTSLSGSPHTFSGAASTIAGTSTLYNVAVTGTYTNNGTLSVLTALSGAGTLTNGAAGILNLGGTSTGTIAASTSGNTVNFNGAAAQTVNPTTYSKLTVSGGGVKTTTGVTVNGTLSIQGTATISAVPTYGATAKLQYNTATSRTAGVEWVTPFTATGGVEVGSTGTITLNAAKVLNASVPLTFSGGKIDLVGFKLTVTSVSGASSTSYVKTSGTGVLAANIANAASFIFPVGNSAYNRVQVTNRSGSADVFSVRVLDEVFNSGLTGTVSPQPHITRTWDISKTTANGGSGVDFIFFWNAGEVSGSVTTPALFHYGTSWIQQTTGVTTNGTNQLTYTGYTGSFSPFAMAQTGVALPVSWLGFSAVRKSSSVRLDWSTSFEKNTRSFQVERSLNGVTWERIGEVGAAQNSATTQSYQFLDAHPEAGASFYRLLQIDLDGHSSYSSVVRVEAGKGQFRIYPNPVSGSALNVTMDHPATLRIFNSLGALVMSRTLQQGTQQVNINSLPRGEYIAESESSIKRFIKQ